MIITPLVLATGFVSGSFDDRIPVSFPKSIPYPPLFKLADGRLSVRFEARVQQGHFVSVTCLEPQKANAEWLMAHPVKSALITLPDDRQSREFEIRFCNISFNPEYPTTYSFWRRSTTKVSK